jgi:hypothetical protein
VNDSLLFKFLFQPSKVFIDLSQVRSPAIAGILRCSILVLLLPPFFSWVGGSNFGWRLGGSEPVFLDSTGAIVFSFFYFTILGIGFIGTVFISRWMASTYGARTSRSLHFAFFTVVCAPLVTASAAHLYPDVFFNVLILLPALLWSITLLYKGLPVVLDIPPERGMLMASALVGWLLVAAVSLLGLSVVLWIKGAGSVLGV